MKKLYSLLGTGFLFVAGYSQTVPPANISLTENYVYTRQYLTETSASNNSLPQVQSVTYFDGLGRPKQTINIKASPLGNDIVTKTEYDALGRQDMDFLPMPQQNTSNGNIYSQATTPYSESVGNPLYGGIAPFFSKKETENSPLSRPLSTTAPGAWGANNKKVVLAYQFNIANEVQLYTTEATTWVENRTDAALKIAGSYAVNQLYKNIVTDEDNNVSIEFKDKQGQTVLVRKILSATENADTYYVYNEYHDLVYVLPPLFADKNKNATLVLATTSTDLKELCYQYRYDKKNRLAEKKLPGKGWEHFVYDNQDRLVMTQDANMRPNNQWLFTKYDQFSRVAYTGMTTGGTRSAEQIILNTKGSNNVARTTSIGIMGVGINVYYDNIPSNNYPNSFTAVLSVNYYDSYPTGSPVIPATILTQNVLPQNAQTSNISTKSLPTASFVKNLDNNAWTKTYIWYDTKGRIIGTNGVNHLGGYTNTRSLLDFSGAVQETYTYHKRTSASTETIIKETFDYDPQNRLLVHKHQVNTQPEEILTQNTYNEIGQLENKKVGGISVNTPLQSIDYAYNIRGWMTGINLDGSGNFQVGKLFNYKINYNNPLQGLALPNGDFTTPVTPKWNGNIAEVLWQKDSDTHINRYGYVYDKLNRLTAGLYQSNLALTSKEHSERLTYDLNGNIITMKRSAYFMGTAADLIDDLTYNNYVGNKFTSITDASHDSNGYEGGGNPITYDDNGNMTDMPDKGITPISYNYLNLPNQVEISPGANSYTIIKTAYRADGVKIKKENTTTVVGIRDITTTVNTTDYLNGFQYLESKKSPDGGGSTGGLVGALETEVAMEREAFSPESTEALVVAPPGGGGTDNAVLQFVPTAEGFYDFIENKYIYQYKDHLGNTRVTYAKNASGSIDVLDKNDYYPFGMNYLDANAGSFFGQSSYKNYKYNGKELQETGMYDYGARMYMPDIAIFGTHDPLSETTMQPYAYAYNNPIYYNDPTGMEGEAAASDDGGSGGETGSGGGGIGEGSGGGTCPPDCGGNSGKGITPASYGNVPGGYDGAPRSIEGAGVNDVAAEQNIQGLEWTKKAQKNSLSVSGSFVFPGGGKGILNSSDIWNSPIARWIVPDIININITNNIVLPFGVNFSPANISILTRGDAGIYTTPTAGLSYTNGVNVDAEFSLSSGTFTGDPRTLNSSNLSGFSAGVSVGLGLGPAVSTGVSYAPKDPLNPFKGGVFYRTVSAGVGLRVGAPTVVSVQGNVNYTPQSGVNQLIKF